MHMEMKLGIVEDIDKQLLTIISRSRDQQFYSSIIPAVSLCNSLTHISKYLTCIFHFLEQGSSTCFVSSLMHYIISFISAIIML